MLFNYLNHAYQPKLGTFKYYVSHDEGKSYIGLQREE